MSTSRKTGHYRPGEMTSTMSTESPEASQPPSPDTRRAAPILSRSVSNISDERTPLLGAGRSRSRLQFGEDVSRPRLSRHQSTNGTLRAARSHSRAGSWGLKIGADRHVRQDSMGDSKSSPYPDDRVWYDQFTSTDWVHDSIADAYRIKALRSRKDVRGRIKAFFDGAQGWILSALIGFITAAIAYVVDVSEAPVFDWKYGFCSDGWLISEKRCCPKDGPCHSWKSWSQLIRIPHVPEQLTEYAIYTCLVLGFATFSCLLTLTTKTVIPSTYHMSTLDENLGAECNLPLGDQEDGASASREPSKINVSPPPMVYYSAAGSGVAEVRVILSGFVLHGFLGVKTLIVKTLALVLSVASGLSLGKEGPYVHIATCVGNIACRLFSKYDQNDGKRREVLSAAAAAGVVVAFGAPIGGVLFSLEEVAYFFPAKTLFRTFFCCITAALTLKFLNPYGTSKIVMFEVRYVKDWAYFELLAFIAVGMLGGAAGAIFIKVSRLWAQSFRKIRIIKRWPLLEVVLVSFITALMGYWNSYTKIPVAKLLLNLASPCDFNKEDDMSLCPQYLDEISPVIGQLSIAFVIKSILTIITFGIKVPAGIYVPSMVMGGILGRIIGHMVQWLVLRFPTSPVFGECAAHVTGASCITPGVYALIAAGSTMCGVTRLSVTLAVILFELTGSLDYVLPFSLAILVAKWTADFLEPLSIYDLLINMNSYPFLNNKHKPIFTSDLADITPRVRQERIIDVSNSPLVPATSLRQKLKLLHAAGEIDGGLPIIRNDILVGLIPAPDLEYALDNLETEPSSLCLMAAIPRIDDSENETSTDPTDFTQYIDPAPVALDVHSPMDLVYECFVKLGLRYICVTRNGQYAGLVHKKTFVKYMRELEEKEGHV